MKAATTAIGAQTQWDYLPLNSGKAATDFYDVDNTELNSTAGYFHFSANINVVSQVRYSDGVGGFRAFNYKYRDATLNSTGRGFQGFDQIIVDDVANSLRSASNYHIKFPLTGSLAEVRKCVSEAGNPTCSTLPIETTKYTYDLWRDGLVKQTIPDTTIDFSIHVLEGTGTDNRYWVSPGLTETKAFETSSSQTAAAGALQPITVGLNWIHRIQLESAFDPNGCIISSVERYEEPGGANRNEVTTNISYLTADLATWWLCRTDDETVSTAPVAGRAIEYASVEVGSDTQTQVKTTYDWDITHRKPSSVTIETPAGGGKPTRTTTVYNPYGLPSSVKVEGTSYNGVAFAMPDRDTTMTYSSDEYFVTSVTNGLGHITSTSTDARYESAVQVTDPNGQITSLTYDVFGRLKSSKAPGEPTVRVAYWWCSGLHGGTAWCPQGDHARTRKLTRAAGAPDILEYFDYLNRKVYELTRNFENNQYYRTRRRFDARGLLSFTQNRHANDDSSTIRTTYLDGYDNLGRLTKQRAPQSNDTYLQTNYAYIDHT
ncbi:MAG: hypothetical protein ACRDGA_12175, partial [Bacteroidota bacterium]